MSKRFRYSNFDLFKPDAEYCNGKRAYDLKGARTAANDAMKNRHQELRIYLCDDGDHYHLTKAVWRSGVRRVDN